MKRILKSKRAFTLAETVLALSVILVVSAATLTLALSAKSAMKKAMYTAQAQHFVYDVIDIYQISSTKEDFENGVKVTAMQDNYTIGGTIVLPSGFLANITFDGTKMTVTITDSDNQRVVAQSSFTKGVALS